MKIIVDGFGGDNAPLAVLEGCAAAVKEYGIDLIVTGDEQVIRKTAAEHQISLDGIEIVHAPDVISMHDDPVTLLKAKSESSMAVAFKLLKDGKGDAFVSGGSTGAIVVGANFIIKRLKGIKRAGLATVIPTIKGCYLLMDAGANLDCKPETLLHFGIMGSIYMEKVMGIKNPKVGLVNVGAEDTKGGDLQKEAYALLTKAPINFTGNVGSARDSGRGSRCRSCRRLYRKYYPQTDPKGWARCSPKWSRGCFTGAGKVAALMLLGKIKAFKKSMDYTEYGGAPLQGAAMPVIKAHGSSNGYAFKNAIRQARDFVSGGVNDAISQALATLREEAAKEKED